LGYPELPGASCSDVLSAADQDYFVSDKYRMPNHMKVPKGMHRMPDGTLMKDSDMKKKKKSTKKMPASVLAMFKSMKKK